MNTKQECLQQKWASRSTSREIFRKYFRRNEKGELDASQLFERSCFQEWLCSRKRVPVFVTRAFQCALRNVITGANGGKSFTQEEEQAVLAYLRIKRSNGWPCFRDSGIECRVSGWNQVRGWHERSETEGSGKPFNMDTCDDDDSQTSERESASDKDYGSKNPRGKFDSSQILKKFKTEIFDQYDCKPPAKSASRSTEKQKLSAEAESKLLVNFLLQCDDISDLNKKSF